MRSENYSFISIRLFHMEYKVDLDFELEILLSRYLIIIGNSLKSIWKFPSIHYMRIYECTYSFFPVLGTYPQIFIRLFLGNDSR